MNDTVRPGLDLVTTGLFSKRKAAAGNDVPLPHLARRHSNTEPPNSRLYQRHMYHKSYVLFHLAWTLELLVVLFSLLVSQVFHAFYKPLEFTVAERDASQCYIKVRIRFCTLCNPFCLWLECFRLTFFPLCCRWSVCGRGLSESLGSISLDQMLGKSLRDLPLR